MKGVGSVLGTDLLALVAQQMQTNGRLIGQLFADARVAFGQKMNAQSMMKNERGRR